MTSTIPNASTVILIIMHNKNQPTKIGWFFAAEAHIVS
jgi:hypothetical protein